jgi:hypothetical protein
LIYGTRHMAASLRDIASTEHVVVKRHALRCVRL